MYMYLIFWWNLIILWFTVDYIHSENMLDYYLLLFYFIILLFFSIQRSSSFTLIIVHW